MKIVGICRKCNGDGFLKKNIFIRRSCPVCSGSGKLSRTLQEYRGI